MWLYAQKLLWYATQIDGMMKNQTFDITIYMLMINAFENNAFKDNAMIKHCNQ